MSQMYITATAIFKYIIYFRTFQCKITTSYFLNLKVFNVHAYITIHLHYCHLADTLIQSKCKVHTLTRDKCTEKLKREVQFQVLRLQYGLVTFTWTYLINIILCRSLVMEANLTSIPIY